MEQQHKSPHSSCCATHNGRCVVARGKFANKTSEVVALRPVSMATVWESTTANLHPSTPALTSEADQIASFSVLFTRIIYLVLSHLRIPAIIRYRHSQPRALKASCKDFSGCASCVRSSAEAAAARVLRVCSERGGNGVWHVDSGRNPLGLFRKAAIRA